MKHKRENPMTAADLNALFEETGTKPTDFIAWAKQSGVTVQDSIVSRHRSGAQGITAPWEIAYRQFFEGSDFRLRTEIQDCTDRPGHVVLTFINGYRPDPVYFRLYDEAVEYAKQQPNFFHQAGQPA